MSLKNKILAAALFGAVAVQTSWALPKLQLDIAGGTYVGGDEETHRQCRPGFYFGSFGFIQLPPAGSFRDLLHFGRNHAENNGATRGGLWLLQDW